MKKYIYILLLSFFLVGMTSCNKEEITIEDPEIIIDPPVEVGYPVAVGIVRDNSGILADTKVAVYQEGELKGTTISNENGQYSTIDIETVEGMDLIIEFSKDDYKSSYRKRSELVLKSASLDVELVINDGLPVYPQLFPGITDYVAISGYIKNTNGGAGYAKIAAELEAIVYDQGVPSNVNIYYSEVTDSDGYYELILPKEATNLRVAIYDHEYCPDYLTEKVVVIVGGIFAQPMGPFTQDVELPDYISYTRTAAPLIELSGQVSDCDGSELFAAQVSFITVAANGSVHVQIDDLESDGTFSYTEDACRELPYTVKVVGGNTGNSVHSDTLEILVTDGTHSDLNIQLNTCNITDSDYSTATMTVDGMDYDFDQILTRMENGGLISDELTDSYAGFTIPNIQLGNNNDILNLELLDWGSFASFKAVNNSMTANVTALTSTEATVVVTGDFDFNSNIVQGTCTLNLKF